MAHHRFKYLVHVALFVIAGTLGALHAEDYAITSLAGVANSTTGADGTPGSFNNPYAVAIDSAKNIYVADTLNNTIRKITPARVVSTLAGTAGQSGSADGTGSAARFNFPVGVAVDGSGNVYVADFATNIIRKITSGGNVTTFAGAVFQPGSTDGLTTAARFSHPSGIATDSSGNIYVAEGGNNTIRKITSQGNVSTLAGSAGQSGFVNGTGSGARFANPFGLTVDSAGNVYVADAGNNAIRKITPSGVVTTVAGQANAGGWVDGSATVARFNAPRGVSVDASGNLFVADSGNHVIRFVTPAGIVSTIAGRAGVQGEINSVGSAALFYDPFGIVVDGATIYVADSSNNQIRRGQPASTAPLPVISVQPFDQEISVGQAVSFSAAATGGSLTYQWLRNGEVIPGATNPTYAIAAAQLSDDGASFRARISGSGGSIDSGPGNLTVFPVGSGSIVITARPLSQNVATGASATFSITASGSGLTYQWLKDGAVIAGATNASFTIPSAQSSDAATYTVRVASNGSSEAAFAKLSVGGVAGGVSINIHPSSQAVITGQAVVFTVNASGPGTISYQWLKNDSSIPGATGSTFTIASAQPGDAGSYTVRVSGGGQNVISNAAILSVGSANVEFTLQPVGQSVLAGQTVVLSVTATGPGALSYQWLKNDVEIAGATASSLTFNSAQPADSGNYSVRVSSGTKTAVSAVVGVTVTAPGPTARLSNLSVRTTMAAGQTLIVGVVVDGGARNILVRAAGPALAAFGLSGAMADPQLELFNGSTSVLQNNDWTADLAPTFASVGAFAFPAGSKDAGFVQSIDGGRSIQARGTGAGVVLVEAYDLGTGNSPRMINVSARNRVGTGDDILIAGFNVAGTGTKQLLIRAVGPKLGAFGVTGFLADPKLEVYSGTTKIVENDNWEPTLAPIFASVGAFALDNGSRDAALVALIAPGSYTVQVSGVSNGTGEALVEIYELP